MPEQGSRGWTLVGDRSQVPVGKKSEGGHTGDLAMEGLPDLKPERVKGNIN